MFWEVECKIKQNDAREGKNMQNSSVIHKKKYAKVCKNKHFFGYKTLVSLKKTFKIDISSYESVQWAGVSGSILSGFWVFLCTFMKVEMTFELFSVTFRLFWTSLDLPRTKNWSKWPKNRAEMGLKWVIWGDFGPFLGRSGVTLGLLRDPFGIVLASFWVVLV